MILLCPCASPRLKLFLHNKEVLNILRRNSSVISMQYNHHAGGYGCARIRYHDVAYAPVCHCSSCSHSSRQSDHEYHFTAPRNGYTYPQRRQEVINLQHAAEHCRFGEEVHRHHHQRPGTCQACSGYGRSVNDYPAMPGLDQNLQSPLISARYSHPAYHEFDSAEQQVRPSTAVFIPDALSLRAAAAATEDTATAVQDYGTYQQNHTSSRHSEICSSPASETQDEHEIPSAHDAGEEAVQPKRKTRWRTAGRAGLRLAVALGTLGGLGVSIWQVAS